MGGVIGEGSGEAIAVGAIVVVDALIDVLAGGGVAAAAQLEWSSAAVGDGGGETEEEMADLFGAIEIPAVDVSATFAGPGDQVGKLDMGRSGGSGLRIGQGVGGGGGAAKLARLQRFDEWHVEAVGTHRVPSGA